MKRRTDGTTLASLQRDAGTMWNEPYLETCCRSALHRLTLVRGHGRPAGLKDGPCLERLAGMGLARHGSEILKRAG